MSTPSEPPLEPEPSLPGRVLYAGCVAVAASALFVLVSGVHAGGDQDAQLMVAQCWHQIEEQQPSGVLAHQMRVSCQQLESSLAPAGRRQADPVVASQD